MHSCIRNKEIKQKEQIDYFMQHIASPRYFGSSKQNVNKAEDMQEPTANIAYFSSNVKGEIILMSNVIRWL